MKRLLGIAPLLLVCGSMATACDICGCSSGGQYLGILPLHYRAFAGIQYQYSSFTINSRSISGTEASHSFEVAQTVTAWGKYQVSKHVQLFGFVPWHSKAGSYDNATFSNSGIGDVTLLANINLVGEGKKTGKWAHQLIAGGGLKAPTGQYKGINELDRAGLPNVQAGTGSWDFVTNFNYTGWRDKLGLNVDAAYSVTTANSDGYKYGNKLNSSVLMFYKIPKKQLVLLPQCGLRYEYALHDYDNYSKKWLNTNSGGDVLYVAAGIQGYLKQYGAKIIVNMPAYQQFQGGNMKTATRLETGVFYLF